MGNMFRSCFCFRVSNTIEIVETDHISKDINITIEKNLPVLWNKHLNITKEICQGKFSNVFVGTYKQKPIVYKRGVLNRPESFMNERRILGMADHPNIVNCLGVVPSEFGLVFHRYLGDLLNLIIVKQVTLTEQEIISFLFQIGGVLAYLHKKNICHGDIKSENILWCAKGRYYLTDFGLSTMNVGAYSGVKGRRGTFEYIAPEVLRREEFGYASDMWSLGVVVWELFTNYLLFDNMNIKQYNYNVLHHPVDFRRFAKHPALLGIQRGLLEKDPRKRLMSDMLMSRLKAHQSTP